MNRRRSSCRLCCALTAIAAIVVVASPGTALGQQAPAESVTVVMTEIEPFVINDEGRAKGFYAEIWHEVAESLGVEYDIIWVETFADVLPAVADGRADVAVAPLAPTSEREAIYDFSSAVVASGPQLGVTHRFDATPSIVRSMFDTRVLSLFAFALLGLLVLAHAIWLFERKLHKTDGDFHESYIRGIWDGLWWSTVTATTVGYGDKAPKSFGGRLVALVAMLSSLVLVGAFVSQVTSIMAEDLGGPGVESLGDVDAPIGVVGGTSFAAYAESQGAEIVEFDTQADLFAAATDGRVNAVISNPFALAGLDNRSGITPVGGVLYEEFETFGLAQGSLWREPINQALADLQSSGEIAEIIKDSLN